MEKGAYATRERRGAYKRLFKPADANKKRFGDVPRTFFV